MMKLTPVDVVDEINKEIFLAKYKESETPIVMKSFTKDWPAREKWSLEYFESLGAEKEVKLYDSKPATDKKLQHAAEKIMPLRDYFELLRKGEKDLRMFFFQILKEIPELKEDFFFPDIGLKFFKDLPVMFLAGKDAKAQMHYDIDNADIVLCHFGAPKKIRLFSPEQTKFMYHVPFSYSAYYKVDFMNPDYKTYPALEYLEGKEVTLKHGDALYIPPGWWHIVEYEGISYSLALRAFPRKTKNFLKMLNNILVIRSIEGIMRKLFGQKWNDRNERETFVRIQRTLASL